MISETSEGEEEAHSSEQLPNKALINLQMTIQQIRLARRRQRSENRHGRIHINPVLMEHVGSPVSMRRIVRNFGVNSGLVIRLHELINNRRWASAWLEIRESNDNCMMF